jgi:hypothetical protein
MIMRKYLFLLFVLFWSGGVAQSATGLNMFYSENQSFTPAAIENYTSQSLILGVTFNTPQFLNIDDSGSPAEIINASFRSPVLDQDVSLSSWTSSRPDYYENSGDGYISTAWLNNNEDLFGGFMDSIFTVVVKCRSSSGSSTGNVFGMRADIGTQAGLRHQSYRWYFVNEDDGALELFEINTGGDYVFVINVNPSGVQAIWTGDTGSFFTGTPYVRTGNWRGIAIAASNNNSNKFVGNGDGRIYGVYYLTGNATLTEAQDLHDNWDNYH